MKLKNKIKEKIKVFELDVEITQTAKLKQLKKEIFCLVLTEVL